MMRPPLAPTLPFPIDLASRMIRRASLACLALAVLTTPAVVCAQEPATEKFIAACAEAGRTAKEKEWFAIQGDAPEWLFLSKELEHLSYGPFWDKAGVNSLPDPAPVIIRYHEDLSKRGVELLLVPVPPKAALMPGKFRKGMTRSDVLASKPFFAKLTAAGVNVLDLEPMFEQGIADGNKLYCEQDAHWSPLTCERVAAKIHALYADQPWAKGNANIVRSEPQTILIKGDLIGDRFAGMAAEKLQVVKVGTKEGDKIVRVSPDDSSPVILLGDSHTLVFSEGGEMHCTGAGLVDHLQQQFGFPLSLVGSMGSGSDSARVRLVRDFSRRKPGYLNGKKLLIWCFTAREFTLGKWRVIPAG